MEDVRSDSEPEPETGSENDESPKASKGQHVHANGVTPALANGLGAGDAACSKKLHSTALCNGHAANGVVCCADSVGATVVPTPPLPPTSNGLVHQLVSNGVPHINA